MAQQVELIPLVCIKCQAPIQANGDEVVWQCTQCGQGMRLDEQKGLVELPIYFTAGVQPGKRGRPFWVADGQVRLQRETYAGNENTAAQKFWSQAHRFFIPAFACDLNTLVDIGTRLLLQPPALQNGPAVAFEPVTLPLEDSSSVAEFIVVGIEAARRDKLKSINIGLSLSAPALWVLP